MDLPELRQRLERLSRRMRVAFAVGCAERVLGIYDVDCQPGDGRLRRGVELAWRFAGGDEVSQGEWSEVEEGLGQATPKIEEQGCDLTSAMFACISLVYALAAVWDESPEAAFQAACSALDAVAVFGPDHEGQWTHAEQAWQEKALALCEAWGERPGRPRMFEEVGACPPEWLRG
jgi:uncharacterized protein YjaG (DUF416 family)